MRPELLTRRKKRQKNNRNGGSRIPRLPPRPNPSITSSNASGKKQKAPIRRPGKSVSNSFPFAPSSEYPRNSRFKSALFRRHSRKSLSRKTTRLSPARPVFAWQGFLAPPGISPRARPGGQRIAPVTACAICRLQFDSVFFILIDLHHNAVSERVCTFAVSSSRSRHVFIF